MEIDALLFECDQRLFGVHAQHVTEVLRAVALSPMPGSPSEVLGMINLRGRVVPVLDTHRILRLPHHPIRHSDHLVVLQIDHQVFALHVDRALDLVRLSCLATDAAAETSVDSRLVQQVAQTEWGMVQLLAAAALWPPAASPVSLDTSATDSPGEAQR